MVTLKELYLTSKTELEKAGIEFPAFDALCIFEMVFGFSGRGYIVIHSQDEVPYDKVLECQKKINERKSRPLQYVLGKWEFMGRDFCVGEGVLIPREDTAVLVNTACEYIGGKSAKVLDLCSGSGAVAISIAIECESSAVDAVEISPSAMVYLEKNISRLCPDRVKAVCADVLEIPADSKKYDVIVSNPPYIPTRDIESLSDDVKCEPVLALDGGSDGLVFYRAITGNYRDLLTNGGMLAVEVGIDQSSDVAVLFRENGFVDIKIYKDLNGIDRVVSGIR